MAFYELALHTGRRIVSFYVMVQNLQGHGRAGQAQEEDDGREREISCRQWTGRQTKCPGFTSVTSGISGKRKR